MTAADRIDGTDASLPDFETIDVSYAGRTVALADLPEYRKFYRKLAEGRWEPGTFEALGRHLDGDTVAIDIGAWIGVTPFWSAAIAKAVVAVEPDPKCAAILKRLAARHESVTVIEGALSDRDTVEINAVDGFGSSETSILDIGNGEHSQTQGIRMDTIMHHAAGSSAVVKIDIEGYEFAIMDELAQLSGYDVRAIQIAIHPQLYEKSLGGSRLMARLKTAVAAWRLGRMFAATFGEPKLIKFSSLTAYILSGIVFRHTPKGADFLFEKPDVHSRNTE